MGIIGIGRLGYLTIQFALAMGYHTTVLSISASKKDESKLFSADQFVRVNSKDAFSDLTDTFDYLFCTAHGGIQWENLFESIKTCGKIIMMGFAIVAFIPTDLAVHELSIQRLSLAIES